MVGSWGLILGASQKGAVLTGCLCDLEERTWLKTQMW